MKRFILLLFSLACVTLSAQNITPVFESTLKVGGLGEEKLYYGFAEGDQLIFDFEEVNGKEMKEVEIAEYPSSSKFMDYKSKKIANKIIPITRTGIYMFRLSNGAISGRICKVKIQRIPGSDATKNFNTSVYWRTLYDTTYTPVQERYLVSRDTAFVQVVDQVAKISSQNALNGNKNSTLVDFTLPLNTISWSYYIGVGKAGKEAYDKAKEKCLNSAAAAAMKIPEFGPLAALALYGVNYFNHVQGEDNVKYYFIQDWANVQAFESGNTFYQYKQGDVINDYSQMASPKAGKVYLELFNDNIVDPIDVLVKVTAVTVTEQWGTRTVQRIHVSSHDEPYLKS